GARLGVRPGDDPPRLLRPGATGSATARPQTARAGHGARPWRAADSAWRLPATGARHLRCQHARRAAVDGWRPRSTRLGPVRVRIRDSWNITLSTSPCNT